MRSVQVVLPASMWAAMPILRVLSKAYSRAMMFWSVKSLLFSPAVQGEEVSSSFAPSHRNRFETGLPRPNGRLLFPAGYFQYPNIPLRRFLARPNRHTSIFLRPTRAHRCALAYKSSLGALCDALL